MSDSAQRAAGAALRGVKAPPAMRKPSEVEPLRPALAIAAMVAAMRARFGLGEADAARLLSPSLADFRDAVGCADPLLVASGEPSLLPLPLPSWAAHLVDEGVLVLDGAPTLQGAQVVQHAHFEVIRELALAKVERFPVVFAGRAAPLALRLHVAVSPPHLSPAWREKVLVRAAARRDSETPVPLWLGPPSAPGEPSAGTSGLTAVTWAAPPSGPVDRAWPSAWPRWAVLRVLEGREPQALWHLPTLWRARMGDDPEGRAEGTHAQEAAALRIAVDAGSTSVVVVEEDRAGAGAAGRKLLAPGDVRSGFRRLAGDPRTAQLVGCGERLQARGDQLDHALIAPGPTALRGVLEGVAGAVDQLWLPQDGDGGFDGEGPCVRVDRFKSPELLSLSDWPSTLGPIDLAPASRKLLESYGLLLGRALAASHAAPLLLPEGGAWSLRWPRLASALAVLTSPACAWSARDGVPFSALFADVGRELCRGLSAAWPETALSLVSDPDAARAARPAPAGAGEEIEVFADFGGLTLQITVSLPAVPGRPGPFLRRTSSSYLLGGERLIDAAAFGVAGLDVGTGLREAWRARARGLRRLISSGGALGEDRRGEAEAQAQAILGLAAALVGRQLDGTIRRAAPDATRLRGRQVRLVLLGEGWKLLALDVPDERREDEALRRIESFLARHPLLPGFRVRLERLTKRALCDGALRAEPSPGGEDAPAELHGVDVRSSGAILQRWFGVADAAAPPVSDAAPNPDDPWWQALAPGESLLRVEQWFTASAPFHSRLLAGKLAFDPRRALLKQWLDVSGPSLVALRIHDALAARRGAPSP